MSNRYDYGKRAASRAEFRLIMALIRPVFPLIKLGLKLFFWLIVAFALGAVFGPIGWAIMIVVAPLVHRQHVARHAVRAHQAVRRTTRRGGSV